MIKIYSSEAQAGLGEQISNNTIAYTVPVSNHVPTTQEKQIAKLFTTDAIDAKKSVEQFDLYYINSVLVSTGCNKNDDVFDTKETWTARNTPEDKQFNFMHSEDDIIGHITGNWVLDAEGNEISDDSEELPEKFDIITSAVIYNSWSSAEKQEWMANLIQEIEAGEWFVSMEAIFNNFDYAVVTPEGQHKIVARKEESSFLTKHLRIYGGTGEYEGHKLGRLLRNIAFSGKGLVSKPANPRSVIFTGSKPFQNSQASEIETFNIDSEKEKSSMADENITLLQKQIDELKSELVEAKSREDSLTQQLSEIDTKSLKDEVETLAADVAEKTEAIAKLEETVATLEVEKKESTEALAEREETLAKLQAEIDAANAEAHKAARLTALTEAGLDTEDAEAKLESFADATDEMFEEIVKLVASTPKVEEEVVEEEAQADEAEAEVVEDEETDEAEAAADEDVLEEAEEVAEASLTDAGETDEVADARTSASDWLRSNVLKSTANLED